MVKNLIVGATIGRPPLNRRSSLATFFFEAIGALIVGVDVAKRREGDE